MKSKTRLYLTIVCMIIVFDVAGSVASRSLRFDYTRLAWVSWCLYATAGYLGFEYRRLMGGVLAGLMAGVTDSTLGWALSTAIRPYVPFQQPHFTVGLISITVVVVTLLGAFFGFLGAFVRWAITRLQKKT